MIYIITGKINSYKTTRLQELYNTLKGDGFVSVKHMSQNKVLYYHIERLSDQSKSMFAIHKDHYPVLFEKVEQLGPYVFDKTVFEMVETTMEQCIKERISPLFIDEIGLLEMNHLGFYNTLKRLINSGLDVYFTCRTSLVESVVKTFNIKAYKQLD
jgi:nucleoside-triphosphatase THEP1